MLAVFLLVVDRKGQTRTRLRYHRIRTYRCGKLVRFDSSLEMDVMGRVTRAKHTITPVSVADFDKQVKEDPGSVRPFQLLLGDMRGGQQLLDSALTDYENYRFRNLKLSPEGMVVVSKLAAIIQQAMTPIFDAAANISYVMAAAQAQAAALAQAAAQGAGQGAAHFGAQGAAQGTAMAACTGGVAGEVRPIVPLTYAEEKTASLRDVSPMHLAEPSSGPDNTPPADSPELQKMTSSEEEVDSWLV